MARYRARGIRTAILRNTRVAILVIEDARPTRARVIVADCATGAEAVPGTPSTSPKSDSRRASLWLRRQPADPQQAQDEAAGARRGRDRGQDCYGEDGHEL